MLNFVTSHSLSNIYFKNVPFIVKHLLKKKKYVTSSDHMSISLILTHKLIFFKEHLSL